MAEHERRFEQAVAKAIAASPLMGAYAPAGLTALQLARTLHATARGLKDAAVSRATFAESLAIAVRVISAPLRANTPAISRTSLVTNAGIANLPTLRVRHGVLGLPFRLILPIAQLFMKSVPQGAATQVLLAASPLVEGITGEYWSDCQVAEGNPLLDDPLVRSDSGPCRRGSPTCPWARQPERPNLGLSVIGVPEGFEVRLG